MIDHLIYNFHIPKLQNAWFEQFILNMSKKHVRFSTYHHFCVVRNSEQLTIRNDSLFDCVAISNLLKHMSTSTFYMRIINKVLTRNPKLVKNATVSCNSKVFTVIFFQRYFRIHFHFDRNSSFIWHQISKNIPGITLDANVNVNLCIFPFSIAWCFYVLFRRENHFNHYRDTK